MGVAMGLPFIMNFSSSGETIFSIWRSGVLITEVLLNRSRFAGCRSLLKSRVRGLLSVPSQPPPTVEEGTVEGV